MDTPIEVSVPSPVARDDIPSEIVTLDSLWRRYRDGFRAWQGVIAGIARVEPPRITALGEYRVFKAPADDAKMVREAMENLQIRLIQVARNRFSAPGTRLEIRADRLADECPAFDLSIDSFDLLETWHYVTKIYGCGAGETAAYRAAAERLWSLLRLSKGGKMKVVGGRVVLSLRIWHDRLLSGKLSGGSRDDIIEAVRLLGAVALWGGLSTSEAVAGMNEIALESFDWNTKLNGGSKVALGELLLGVGYQTKFEFRMSAELAEKLQLFMAEFRTAPQEVAAA